MSNTLEDLRNCEHKKGTYKIKHSNGFYYKTCKFCSSIIEEGFANEGKGED